MAGYGATDVIIKGATSVSVYFALSSRVTISDMKLSFVRTVEGDPTKTKVYTSGALTALASLITAYTSEYAYYASATVSSPAYLLLRVDIPNNAFANTYDGEDADKVICSVYDDGNTVYAHRVFDLHGENQIYEGRVWFDSTESNTGTQDYVDGIPANPVSLEASAITIAGSMGLKTIHNVFESTWDFTTVDYSAKYEFEFGTYDLGSTADIEGCIIRRGIIIAGDPTVDVGATYLYLDECTIGNTDANAFNLPRTRAWGGSLRDAVHLCDSGDYQFHGLRCNAFEDSEAVLDFNNTTPADPGATNVVISGFTGKLKIKNMKTTDTLELTGEGEVTLDSTCDSASAVATISGAIKLDDNSSNMTVNDNTTIGHGGTAPWTQGNTTTPPTAAAIADAVWDETSAGHIDAGKAGAQLWTDIDAILVDTAEIGVAGAGLTEAGGTGDHLTAIPWNSAWDAQVESECNDALVAFFTSSAQLVDDIWDELLAGHTTLDSAGKTLADILVDTAEIGVAGAGLTEAGGTGDHLTAIPWNSAWDAQVQSECEDAINALFNLTAGIVESNLKQINDLSVVGNLATLTLKQLDITNSGGAALIAHGSTYGIDAEGDTAGIYATGTDGIYAKAGSANGFAGNGSGIKADGDGTGHGIESRGGASGNGIDSQGGGTAGHGINAEATAATGDYDGIRTQGVQEGAGIYSIGGADGGDGIWSKGGAGGGNGFRAQAQGTADGIRADGSGSGHGMDITGGATGNGINANGGATSGHGISTQATAGTGDYDGIRATGVQEGAGFYSIGGPDGGDGIWAKGGAGGGNGFRAQAQGTADGIRANGSGSGHGIETTGGTTGNGVHASGGATSGHGISAQAAGSTGDYHGINAVGINEGNGLYGEGGPDGDGLYGKGGSTGGVGIRGVGTGGSGDGFKVSGSGIGNGMEALGGGTNGNGFSMVKSGSGKDIDADEIDQILADTNELQTDWTNGGRLDLILDDVLADTNELQTDWANGGRLDLLLDAVKAKTDNLPDGVKKNTALSNFQFLMVDSADNVSPKTNLSPAGEVLIDNGTWGALTNTPATEVGGAGNGKGMYRIDLAAADLNGDIISLRFTGVGANTRYFTIKTEE